MPDDPISHPGTGLNRLDPRVRKVWAIKLAAVGAVAFFVAVIYDVSNLFDSEQWFQPGVVSVAVLVLFTGLALTIPRFRYRYWWFELTGEELVLERGILNRIRTIVPLRRVQHLDVSQDIVEREFDLGKLIVHTAGTRSSEVVLPGLPLKGAEGLRDRIKAYILDDAL